jgi:hypothetical protein
MAAATSIILIRFPPIKFPKVLVSLGITISVMMVSDSFTCFAFGIRMMIFSQKYVQGLNNS